MALGRNVVAAVFGATSGLNVVAFKPDRAEKALETSIPWESDETGALYWPESWLKNWLHTIKGLAAEPGNVLALAMPGADIALLGASKPVRIQHYQSIPGEYLDKALGRISAQELYLRTNGANVAFFQPYCQLLAYQDRQPGSVVEAGAIVPLADLMTLWLTGKKGHDPVMLQSQGLYSRSGRKVCEEILDISPPPGTVSKTAPWPCFPTSFYLSKRIYAEWVHLLPVTHDSVPARMVGFAECPWVLWTGTWIGTATLIAGQDIQPSEETFKAGLAFEGLGGSQAAITNVAMLGSVYKALIQKAGCRSYGDAAEIATLWLDEKMGHSFALEGLPKEPDQAADWILRQYSGMGYLSVTATIRSAANACYEKIKATAKVLGLEMPKEVAIIGGWAENKAFIKALAMLGLIAKIPPHATYATHAGLAADALIRVGDAPNFAEALQMLPPLE